MANASHFTAKQKLVFTIIANFMMPLGGMSTDIYLPSLPAMVTHFDVANSLIQLTVTAYVIAMGIGQLFAGPLSDAHGRKKLILVATFLQLVSVIAILISSSIYGILFFRFTQGLGAAFMMVPGRAIIRDLFSGNEFKKQFNYITMSFALAPIIAPFIGGYFQHYIGWQANFIFILTYILVVLLLVSFVYKETSSSRRPFLISHFVKNYQTILSNRKFLTKVLFISILTGYFSLFTVTGPFLIQTAMHKTAIVYGHVALLMGLAWFLGNTLNRVSSRYSHNTKTVIAVWFTFLAAICLFLLTEYGFFNIFVLAAPIFIMIFLSGLIFPIFVGECLVIFKDLSASANGCLFSMMWLFWGGYTILAATLKANTAFPLSISYIAVSIVSMLFYYGLVRRVESN